jgi:hypothetical protein
MAAGGKTDTSAVIILLDNASSLTYIDADAYCATPNPKLEPRSDERLVPDIIPLRNRHAPIFRPSGARVTLLTNTHSVAMRTHKVSVLLGIM